MKAKQEDSKGSVWMSVREGARRIPCSLMLRKSARVLYLELYFSTYLTALMNLWQFFLSLLLVKVSNMVCSFISFYIIYRPTPLVPYRPTNGATNAVRLAALLSIRRSMLLQWSELLASV